MLAAAELGGGTWRCRSYKPAQPKTQGPIYKKAMAKHTKVHARSWRTNQDADVRR